MINIYKQGGDWSTVDGKKYSIKSVDAKDKGKYLADGWVSKLDLIDDIEDGVFEEVAEKPKTEKKQKKGS